MSKNSTLLIDIGQGLSLMLGLPTLASWNTLNRPNTPKVGTFGFNIETNNLEYWNGSNWLVASLSEA